MPKSRIDRDKSTTDNLILLRGERGNVIVGNRDNFRPLHIEKGDAFLKLLDNIANQGVGSIEQSLLELLHSHEILTTESQTPQKPPMAAATCCGRIGEHTLFLPLAEKVNQDIYSSALSYVLKTIRNDGTLSIKFYGQDPLLSWHLVEKIAQLANDKRDKRRPDVILKFHFDSYLGELSKKALKWLEHNIASFSVLFPLPGGLAKMNHQHKNIKENLKKLLLACVQASLVTPAVKGNIHELMQIAEHHANFNRTGGFHFPAVRSPEHCWNYGNEEDLPDADEYSQALVELYKAACIEDDLFTPVNELRHRIANAGYSARCSCLYDHVTAVDSTGNIYPCVAALHSRYMVMGNVSKNPESNSKSAQSKFKVIQKKYWQKCNGCRWRALCGMSCPLISNLTPDQDNINGKKIIENYVCKPRLALIEKIIWDIVEENKQ